MCRAGILKKHWGSTGDQPSHPICSPGWTHTWKALCGPMQNYFSKTKKWIITKPKVEHANLANKQTDRGNKLKLEVKSVNVITSSYKLHTMRHPISLRAIFNCCTANSDPVNVWQWSLSWVLLVGPCVSEGPLLHVPWDGLFLFWRPDSPIRTEWGGICLTLAKDLS